VDKIPQTTQYFKFSAYGFLKNLRFFDVFFILFLNETGINYLQIGFLYSIRQIVTNLFEIPSGIIADVFGRKNSLLFALGAYIVSFLIFYFSGNYYYFIIAMILYGLGEAFRSGTHKAIILNYLKKQNLLSIKTRYYGGTRSWSQFGSAISSLIAMAIVLINHNYRDLFIFTSIPYIINLINIASYPGDAFRKNKEEKTSGVLKAAWNGILENLKEYIKIFRFVDNFRAFFSAAAYIAVFKTLKDYLQPILESIAISLPVLMGTHTDQRTAIMIGAAYFLIFTLTSVASRNAWRFEDKSSNIAGAINMVYLTGILSIGISGLFLWLGYNGIAALVFIILYLIQNIRRPLMVGYLSDLISGDVMASGLSTESQLETLLIIIYAPVFGWFVDSHGLAFALGVTCLVFLLLFPLVKIRSIQSTK
jgi:MFS family permease